MFTRFKLLLAVSVCVCRQEVMDQLKLAHVELAQFANYLRYRMMN